MFGVASWRWCGVLGAGVGVLGCSLAFDVSEYEEVELDTALDQLRDGCAECLRTTCESDFGECAASEDCVDYAHCRTQELTPYAHGECARGEKRSSPDVFGNASFRRLTQCSECADACRFGEQWECVDRYSWPRIGSDRIVWRHRIVDNFQTSGGEPVPGLTVRACRRLGQQCGPNVDSEDDLISMTTTDEDGWFEFELDVDRDSSGFTGYFVLSGDEIPTYRMHFSAPLQGGYDQDEIMTNRSVELSRFPMPQPGFAFIVFQALDCASVPAPNITFRAITEDVEFTPLYNDGMFGEPFNLTGTTREGLGIGGAIDVDPELGSFSLEFTWDGERVSRLPITVASGEITLVQAVAEGAVIR